MWLLRADYIVDWSNFQKLSVFFFFFFFGGGGGIHYFGIRQYLLNVNAFETHV